MTVEFDSYQPTILSVPVSAGSQSSVLEAQTIGWLVSLGQVVALGRIHLLVAGAPGVANLGAAPQHAGGNLLALFGVVGGQSGELVDGLVLAAAGRNQTSRPVLAAFLVLRAIVIIVPAKLVLARDPGRLTVDPLEAAPANDHNRDHNDKQTR